MAWGGGGKNLTARIAPDMLGSKMGTKMVPVRALNTPTISKCTVLRGEAIRDDGRSPKPLFWALDVAKVLEERVFASIVEELGGLDLIVYVAGYMPRTDDRVFNPEIDRKIMEVNAMGAIDWLDFAANHFRQQGHGALAAISSVSGDRGRRRKHAYGASKAALDTFMEGLRNTLSVEGIRVTTIRPGFVDTAMTSGLDGLFWVVSPEKVAERTIKAIEKGEGIVYFPARWRIVMWIIRNIPSFLFRRLNI